MLKLLENSSTSNELITDFVTFDIETVNFNKTITPYLICGFDGNNYITSFSLNQSELFSSFINQLFTLFKDKNSLIVYAHNFSGFDGIFLMKHLINYGKVEPLLFNGKLMSIKIKLNVEEYKGKTIIFKDSMLLLPSSLRALAKAFNLVENKGTFPVLFNNIYYKGLLPKFEYFQNVSLHDYGILISCFKDKVWNFKDESIKYCKLDCKLLHEILIKFNELVFNKWKLNIHDCLTIPSLAMKLFKTHYLQKDTVYQLHSVVEQNIRKSYTGGAVDVYIPSNKIFNNEYEKLFIYDVNALYPTQMANLDMPIGKPVAFDGDIRKIDPQAFGFFYCNITSPAYLEHPILQHKVKTNHGVRTIAGLGSWTDWIFSTEMDNAIKYGYTFDILKGYEFDRGNLFKDYINDLFNLRLQFDKSNPMNMIAKLLMNSLYGKFGMKMEVTKVDIFDVTDVTGVEYFEGMLEFWGETVHDYVKLDTHYIVVRNSISDLKYDSGQDIYHGTDVNIAIASAITAYGRINMSYFKNNPNFNLYYSDTDSAVIDAPLPPKMVGNELGQLKLEHVIERAVFLAPKVYGLVTQDGKEVIKIKGITQDVVSTLSITDLEALLEVDSSREFTQSKWYKKVINGDINVNDIAYTLRVTSNKREAIYIDGVYENTVPFNYDAIIK